MSGVYIRGMEMPKNCYRCRFFRMSNNWNKNDEADILFRCVLTGKETWDYTGGYLPNCPLIPVPDHGRLIDADALCKTLRSLAENEYTPEVFANWIENHIDTIIPAAAKKEKTNGN